MNAESPRISLVTGASRGAGKGIALALGSMGDIVYVTGRSQKEGDAPLPGTVYATAEEITKRGGQGIPVICDHGNDADVAKLFSTIVKDHGRLDILVNNATQLHDELPMPGPFWEKSPELVNILDVGLKSSYMASYYAAKIMSEQGSGLIVFTSSPGAACYMHGPAYGAQKAATDKMAHDMSVDLNPFNVSCISLWLGILKTERTDAVMKAEPEKYAHLAAIAESPEFTGRLIDALFQSSKLKDMSGQTFIGAELGVELGIKDVDGKQPASHREHLGGPTQFNPAIVE